MSHSKTKPALEKLPSFDWDKAKNFYYIAKLENMTEAAKQLHITQSSLSRQLTLLEDSLQCKLFIRTGRGLKMTRKGEELYAIIERTFLDLKGFSYNQAAMADNGQKRKIRIATTHALAAYIFNDLLIEYNKQHPYIHFELIGDDHLIDVILNDVDIAIRTLDPRIKGEREEQQGVHYDYLFSLEKKLYASKEYIKKYGEPQTVEDLKKHQILAHAYPEEHPYSDVNWILRLGLPEGKFHEPVFASNSVECLVDNAIEGVGIIGSYQEYKIIKNSRLVNILPDIKAKPIKEYFITPDYIKDDKEIMQIKKFLKEKLTLS